MVASCSHVVALIGITLACLLKLCGSKGIIVIPGLGRSDRLLTVISNLKLLERDYINGIKFKWDCVVYVYAARTEDSFWSMTAEVEYLQKLCKVIENPNKRVTENLFMLQPILMRGTYNKVFILLDDCKLPGVDTFDLMSMLKVMKQNELTVISPMIAGANKGGGQKFRNIMQTAPLPGTVGYVSSFVEIFVWVMTLPAYEALWELLCPHINPYGWGYDFWYDGYAKQRVSGHKMGIMSSVVVDHVQNTSEAGSGRTDNTDIDVKWKAVEAQERHYKRHLKVDLKRLRDHLDIANTSWNGAVKGYLTLASAGTATGGRRDRFREIGARVAQK